MLTLKLRRRQSHAAALILKYVSELNSQLATAMIFSACSTDSGFMSEASLDARGLVHYIIFI